MEIELNRWMRLGDANPHSKDVVQAVLLTEDDWFEGPAESIPWMQVVKWRLIKRHEKPRPELKPCPFCGGPAGVRRWFLNVTYYVYCNDCAATASSHMERVGAMKAWNQRKDAEDE